MGGASTAWNTSVAYMRTSAIAGLSHAANAKNRVWSFYWLIIFIVGFVATAYNIYTLLDDYHKYPVTTTTDLVHESSVYFPAVTICNQNRIHCQNLINHLLTLREELELNVDLNEAERTSKLAIMAQLEEMLDVTDCRTQICNYISDAFEVHDDTHTLLSYLMHLDCVPSFRKTFKAHVYEMCYYIFRDFDIDPELMTALWQYSECSNVDVCHNLAEWEITPANFYTNATLSQECQDWIDDDAFIDEETKANYFGFEDGEEDPFATFTAAEAVHEAFRAENYFVTRYMQLNENLRKTIGHHFGVNEILRIKNNTGFFRACSLRGESCLDPKLWEVSNVPGYGNCFTFNAAYNEKDTKAPRNATLTGVSNGLTIELFLHQYNYMLEGLSQKAGVRVVIHSPHSFPMVDASGIDLSPGAASSLAIQMNDITRMRPPFVSMCINEWEETDLDISVMASERPQYSYTVCQSHCVQMAIIKTCDCYHTQLDMDLVDLNKAEFKTHQRPCNRLPNQTSRL